MLAVVYSLILTGLDNIQEDMENPFDERGTDDIRFDYPIALFHTSLSQPSAKVDIESIKANISSGVVVIQLLYILYSCFTVTFRFHIEYLRVNQ